MLTWALEDRKMEQYQELSLLGVGAFGSVTKCRNLLSGHLVAVKKYFDRGDYNSMDKTLSGEITLLKQCRHDNVVKLLDVLRQDGHLYLVFELLECSVADEMSNGPFPPDTVRSYSFQLIRAVDYLHSSNIIHRDIDPENMLVSRNGVMKLCDFGCALKVEAAGLRSRYVGKPAYMAPEILLGDGSHGTPIDVWAIGITILTMATGQDFILGDCAMGLLNDIVTKVGPLPEHQMLLCGNYCPPEVHPPTDLLEKYGLISVTLAHLVEACLQTDPGQRWRCSEMLEHDYFKENDFQERFTEKLCMMSRLDEETILREEEKKEEEEEEEEEGKEEEKGKEKKQGRKEIKRLTAELRTMSQGDEVTALKEEREEGKEEEEKSEEKTGEEKPNDEEKDKKEKGEEEEEEGKEKEPKRKGRFFIETFCQASYTVLPAAGDIVNLSAEKEREETLVSSVRLIRVCRSLVASVIGLISHYFYVCQRRLGDFGRSTALRYQKKKL